MRVVIQRVSRASVAIEDKVVGEIDAGLLVLCGFEDEDHQEDLEWTANKIVNMRIFNDADQKMNLSIMDIQGNILLVSQFTLFAQIKKGNRPGFTGAAKPEKAIKLYEQFINKVSEIMNKPAETGVFGADMQIELVNDGPVTICIDSNKRE